MPASTLAKFQRITPQQLRAFEATARLLSVTAAAKSLFVSQPTVSVQLRELSETIGEQLFETVGRKIRLTQAGEALYVTVRELAGCWQRLEANLAEINGLVSGRLRIAAVTTAEYFVPDLLGPFVKAYPGIEIELAIENRDRIVQRLQQGVDDLTVMMLPPTELPLERIVFQRNPIIIIAPTSHPKCGKAISLADLADEPWLMREVGSGTRMAAEAHFASLNFSPKIAMSLGSNEAIKHAVAAGLGIGVLSKIAVNPHISAEHCAEEFTAGIAVLDVAHFPCVRHWSVVWHKSQPLSAAARAFIAYLQDR